ncbi:hypothetical protein B0H13DRAFT_1883463 [Mycena leptocephala]|nr:hypothetical protein B0H13DRAFT_1883463 [Mycena leptocephala]
MDEELPEPDPHAICKHFKGRCTPSYGQCFDPETGVERHRPITKDIPSKLCHVRASDAVDPPPGLLGGRLISSGCITRSEERRYDATAYGREVGTRYDSSEPMAYAASWVEAMTRDDWMDQVDRRCLSGGEAMAELEDRQADVLQHGYLIIGEAAEFHLRFQVVTNAAIHFPRHVLEVAMEHGIQFSIGFKAPDCACFRPKNDDYEDLSWFVTKAIVDLRVKGPRPEESPSLPIIYPQYCGNMGKMARSPQARALITRGGGASWLMRAFVGIGLCIERELKIRLTPTALMYISWDDVSEGDYEAVFGYIQGGTLEQDKYLFPTYEIVEEFSDHYYREWNPFCDRTFRHIKDELDDGRGKARTRSEWKHYFQSSN